MNDVINEIMKECYLGLAERQGDNEYNMEKFAELIINQCIDCCIDSGSAESIGQYFWD